MTQSQVPLEFLRSFRAGDTGGLPTLLTEDTRFRGPLYRFDSKAAYLDCLEKIRDPLVVFDAHVVVSLGSENC